MNDIYSKAVMTVIAVALTVIAGNQLLNPAWAQSSVWVENWPSTQDVWVDNWP